MKIILSYYPWRLFSPKNNKCATFLLEIVIPRSQNNEEKLNVTSALRHAKSQWGNKNELFFRLSFWIAGCWKCATNRARVNISDWMLFSNSYSWESKNSTQTTLVVDVLELVWWALHTSWSELWRCMKKLSWHGVYFTSIKVNTEMFFWEIWELSCRMLPSLVNTCASCRLSASVAKSKKQYIYGIKLKFLTKFYEKFEQREAIRTFCSENLEHVLSLLRGPVYWIIEFLGPEALQCFTFLHRSKIQLTKI